jgi:hypothetical protein
VPASFAPRDRAPPLARLLRQQYQANVPLPQAQSQHPLPAQQIVASTPPYVKCLSID